MEENPGPATFNVTDLTTIACADYSKRNESLFGGNVDKQCVAMSLTAIIYHY